MSVDFGNGLEWNLVTFSSENLRLEGSDVLVTHSRLSTTGQGHCANLFLHGLLDLVDFVHELPAPAFEVALLNTDLLDFIDEVLTTGVAFGRGQLGNEGLKYILRRRSNGSENAGGEGILQTGECGVEMIKRRELEGSQ